MSSRAARRGICAKSITKPDFSPPAGHMQGSISVTPVGESMACPCESRPHARAASRVALK
jgi:hypothetical protein